MLSAASSQRRCIACVSLHAHISVRVEAKNEDGKLAAENFVGRMTKNDGANEHCSFPSRWKRGVDQSYQQACLTKLDEATIDAYLRILRQFTEWVAERPGHAKHFQPDQLTMTVVEGYLSRLKEQGYSVSHRTRVKSVIKHFCQWLIDEKEALKRNPTSGSTSRHNNSLPPRPRTRSTLGLA